MMRRCCEIIINSLFLSCMQYELYDRKDHCKIVGSNRGRKGRDCISHLGCRNLTICNMQPELYATTTPFFFFGSSYYDTRTYVHYKLALAA